MLSPGESVSLVTSRYECHQLVNGRLDEVSTARGTGGFVGVQTHPLPRAVLTSSKLNLMKQTVTNLPTLSCLSARFVVRLSLLSARPVVVWPERRRFVCGVQPTGSQARTLKAPAQGSLRQWWS